MTSWGRAALVLTCLGALAAPRFLGAGPNPAAPPSVAAAAGLSAGEGTQAWNRVTLTTIRRDPLGRRTLERGSGPSIRVERRTRWNPDGARARETVLVTGARSRRTLHWERRTWDASGAAASADSEDDAFNPAGRQVAGRVSGRTYFGGRLAALVRQRYLPQTRRWQDTCRQSFGYFADGDLKLRITDNPSAGERRRETWGARDGARVRPLILERWDARRGVWIPA